jgi:hypothetical protein
LGAGNRKQAGRPEELTKTMSQSFFAQPMFCQETGTLLPMLILPMKNHTKRSSLN